MKTKHITHALTQIMTTLVTTSPPWTISCYTGAATPLSHAGGSAYAGGMDYSDIGGQLEGFDDCMDLQSFGCFPDLANPLFPLSGGQPPKSN